MRERERDRDRWERLRDVPASRCRPRGVASEAGGAPDMDMNVLTLEARVMVPIADASFGVGGEAREPAETDMGDERCGELI